MIVSTHEHSGQYRAYGDSYYVWKIKATEGEGREAVLDYCKAELSKSVGSLEDVPEKGEWQAASQYGGTRWGDASYYFRGYYSLVPGASEGEWTFTRCRPFCD